MRICTVCWQGRYRDGICENCQHPETAVSQRREDALPLMNIVRGRYSVGEVMGKGGFGITYSAWDNAVGRRVALKELFPNASVSRGVDGMEIVVKPGHEEYFAGMKEKFEEEARLLRLLGSDCGIVQVYDLFHCNGTVYYAMEFLEGSDLNVYRMKHGRLSWEFLEPIVRSLLETLGVLHGQNLIHRDISPDNILLQRDGSVRLIDFGSARTYQGKMNFTVQKKDGFAPWEQTLSDGKQGPWTDLYALSATIYLLLSGKLPPKAEKRVRGEEALIPLKQLCPEIPNSVAWAVEKGMNVKIKDRFLSADAYMEALGFLTPMTKPAKIHATIKLPTAVGTPVMPPVSNTGGMGATKKHAETYQYWLYGRGGIYAGKRKQLSIGQEVTLGRLPANDVVYPEETVGVSRRQCVLRVMETGEFQIRDAGSAFGTYLNDRRIGREWTGGSWGCLIRFGNEVFELIRLKRRS